MRHCLGDARCVSGICRGPTCTGEVSLAGLPSLDFITYQPPDLFFADMNADGRRDFVSRDGVFLDRGDGGWTKFTMGYTGLSLTLLVADLIGDSRPEVIAGGGARLEVWRDARDGGFEIDRFIAAPFSRSIALGDLDGDGRMDLVLGGGGFTEGVGALLATDAGFTALPPMLGPLSNVRIADLDGDGKSEILASVTNLSIGLPVGLSILSLRDGGLVEVASLMLDGGVESTGFAELTGDARPEVVASICGNYGEPCAVQTFSVSDELGLQLQSSMQLGTRPTRILLADMDNDADLDVVVTLPIWPPGGVPSGTAQISLLSNNRTGTLIEAGSFDTGISQATPNGILAADVTGDGLRDLIIAAGTNEYIRSIIFPATGAGTFLTSRGYPVPHQPGFTVAGDLNSDRVPDVVFASGLAVGVLFATDGGGFEPPTTLAELATNRVLIADVNGDGANDLLAPVPGDGVVAAFMSEDGGLSPRRDLAMPGILDVPVVADLDSDGLADIVCRRHDGRLELLRGTGNGTFSAPTLIEGPVGVHSAVALDLDGDGRADLAARETGYVATFVQRDSRLELFERTPTVNGGYKLAAGDFDGDGRDDLLVGGPGIEVLINIAGHFVYRAMTDLPFNPFSLEVADADGDGDLDAFIWENDDNRFALLRNNGNGVFTPSLFKSRVRGGVDNLAVGDFNGDGRPDVAIGDSTHMQIRVFLNRCY